MNILGIRGLPPQHGGFETFVGRLAPYLAEQGYDVNVFCQNQDGYRGATWKGVRLTHLNHSDGPAGTVLFDVDATVKAALARVPTLVFGYNTALLNVLLSLRGVPYAINMDGVEWRRRKWNTLLKAWFYINEGFAARTAPILIADHPAIADHLRRRNHRATIETIPYGATAIVNPTWDPVLDRLNLRQDAFATIIARPEPENSVLEMVRAFSSRTRHGPLVVLGRYSREIPYQRAVLDAASDQVLFAGAIYETAAVEALRSNSNFYLYGHTVGGTSPTLVEALAAGATPVCLDSVYSRWVAGAAGRYFSAERKCSDLIDRLFAESKSDRTRRREECLDRFEADFTWDTVLSRYREVIEELSE